MKESIERQENADKACKLAMTLYPHEKWETLEAGIFIAKSRMPYIQRKGYTGGIILAYFSQSGEFYQWTENELRQKKSGSCDPAAIRGKSDIPKCPR